MECLFSLVPQRHVMSMPPVPQSVAQMGYRPQCGRIAKSCKTLVPGRAPWSAAGKGPRADTDGLKVGARVPLAES